MEKKSLVAALKTLFVEELKLPRSADSIDENAALFGAKGLGIDSIDALQLGAAAEARWGVKLDPASNEGKAALSSISALADYILSQKK